LAVAVQSAASISRVLALSVSVLARHFPIFFLVGTISILPPLLLRRLLGSEQIFDGSPAAVVEWLVYALLTRLLLTIGECTVIMPTAFQALRRQPANFVNSLKAGLPRVIPVILIELITVLLAGLAVLVTFVLALIPALILGLILGSMWPDGASVLVALALVPGEILLTLWFVGAPACVIERMGPWTSLRRSVELTKGHFWMVLGLLLFLRIGSLIAGNLFPSLGSDDRTVHIISAWLWYAIWFPYWSIVLIATYHDLRVTQEGVQQVA